MRPSLPVARGLFCSISSSSISSSQEAYEQIIDTQCKSLSMP
jgi:hypothetical protein